MADILRVFVVDDSVLFRKILGDAIQELPLARLSGYAKNGQEAIDKIELLQPDVVTLDVEMPVMDGLTALGIIKQRWPQIRVVMVTSLNKNSVASTINALEAKAFSFIPKPDDGTSGEIKSELFQILNAIHSEQFGMAKPRPVQRIKRVARTATGVKPTIVAIGISTGGPNALAQIIPTLPETFPLPILIVQHMPAAFTKPLADSLNKKSAITVKEAEHGEQIQKGVVYIAPGGTQMKVSPANGVILGTIVITDDAPQNYCKPSVDYLFRSLSQEVPGRVLSVIMTGMGSDGTKGMQLLKRHGGVTIGQNKGSCTVYGMPCAAQEAGVVDYEVPLTQIIPTILKNI